MADADTGAQRPPMEAQELRARRHALGLSQAALGKRLGVTANTVARWERGELSMHHAEMIRLALIGLAHEAEERSAE